MSNIDFSQMQTPELLSALGKRREIENSISRLLAKLAETDWLVIREAESGELINPEVREERKLARAEVSRLRAELETLPAC